MWRLLVLPWLFVGVSCKWKKGPCLLLCGHVLSSTLSEEKKTTVEVKNSDFRRFRDCTWNTGRTIWYRGRSTALISPVGACSIPAVLARGFGSIGCGEQDRERGGRGQTCHKRLARCGPQTKNGCCNNVQAERRNSLRPLHFDLLLRKRAVLRQSRPFEL